jgi:phage terminase small subunit
MPKRAMKKVPRINTTANDRQELFALEYVKDYDKIRAIKAAGYSVTTEESARDAACRLLRNPTVREIINREKVKVSERVGITAAGVVARFYAAYLDADARGDLPSAISALREIGKHLGIYEKHNVQKKYSQEDVEKLKLELEQAGFDFKRLNYRSEN